MVLVKESKQDFLMTRPFDALREAGLMGRRRSGERPPRDAYVPTDVPTELGGEFSPVLIALLAWGNRHFAPEGASFEGIELTPGRSAEPALVAKANGYPRAAPDQAAGQAAGDVMRRRFAPKANDAAPAFRKGTRARRAHGGSKT